MATLTSTELGATGRFIRFSPTAALNDLGSQTIMSRCRPNAAGGGGFGYLYGKTVSSSITGIRLFIDGGGGAPFVTFGANSTTQANQPLRSGAANSISYNVWQDIAATWDGALNSSGIALYVNGSNISATAVSAHNGSGAVASDAANPVLLMNREGLGREFVGDMAWLAVWNRVLTTTEMNTARSDGPLAVPDGLVLLWANQADLGPSGLTPQSRSTYVAGALPPNTALGGDTPTNPVSFAGTVPAQSWVEGAAIAPLNLSTYFSGDLTPFSYAITSGTLPAGLSLNASTGVISGTPTTPTSAVNIVVTATDSGSNAASTNSFSVTITAAVVVVRGVEVVLHDRATLNQRANVTGITARWWDSPTAEGAPLLKTDLASTDASGLLTLDLDAVTSLAVGGTGYLVLYKAGAGPDTDLHFAGRWAVSDIA